MRELYLGFVKSIKEIVIAIYKDLVKAKHR